MKHASIASDGKKGSDASVAIRCGQLAANSAANANIRYGCDNRPGIYYSCRAVREHEINSSSRSSVGLVANIGGHGAYQSAYRRVNRGLHQPLLLVRRRLPAVTVDFEP